jgi:hypothetical protein
VLFSRETPLGWARKLIQKSSSSISEITLTPQQETTTINTLEENKSGGDLPELFNNALDQIWKD